MDLELSLSVNYSVHSIEMKSIVEIKSKTVKDCSLFFCVNSH